MLECPMLQGFFAFRQHDSMLAISVNVSQVTFQVKFWQYAHVIVRHDLEVLFAMRGIF